MEKKIVSIILTSCPKSVYQILKSGSVAIALQNNSSVRQAIVLTSTIYVMEPQIAKIARMRSSNNVRQRAVHLLDLNAVDILNDRPDKYIQIIAFLHLLLTGYGACVDERDKCNGIQNCADNSDENDLLCGYGKPSKKKPQHTVADDDDSDEDSDEKHDVASLVFPSKLNSTAAGVNGIQIQCFSYPGWYYLVKWDCVAGYII